MQNLDQTMPPPLPETDRRLRKLENANRRQLWAIVVLFVVAVFLALRSPTPAESIGLASVNSDGVTVVDSLQVKNQIVVGEYPNVIYLQTGETKGAWVWVRAGKTRSAFVHVPLKEHGRPTFALYDDDKKRSITADY